MQEAKSYSHAVKEISYNASMDKVREIIVKKADERGETLASLSKQLGKNHAYLQQFVKRGIPVKLPEDVRRNLSVLISVPEEELGGPTGAPAPSSHGLESNAGSFTRNGVMGAPVNLGSTIPLYGHAAGGPDGQFILNGNKVADILAPPSLAGVQDAYAVYVVGESMINRYYPGEAVFVNPRAPVRKGDFVVAQIAADEGEPPYAYVKQYDRRDEKFLYLKQLNPKKTLRFPSNRVVSVHRIIMGGDG